MRLSPSCSACATRDQGDKKPGLSETKSGAGLGENPGFRFAQSGLRSPNDKERGMADMSKKFIDMGAEVYVDQAVVVKEQQGVVRMP